VTAAPAGLPSIGARSRSFCALLGFLFENAEPRSDGVPLRVIFDRGRRSGVARSCAIRALFNSNYRKCFVEARVYAQRFSHPPGVIMPLRSGAQLAACGQHA